MSFFDVCLISGPAFLIFGIIMLIKRRKFVSNSILIRGTVIDTQKRYSKGNVYYYPVIEYYNKESRIMETFTPIDGSKSPKYKKGDAAELRYCSAGSKKQVHLNTWYGIWGSPALLILWGVIIMIFGIISKIWPSV